MTILFIVLLAVNTILLVVLLTKQFTPNNDQERLERLVRAEISQNREELSKNLSAFSQQLIALTQMNEQKLEKVRDVVEKNLRSLQEDNNVKLEKIRETVDEKLHSTLEKRLGESFQLVSERLEKVHEGLGEMQSLASGVGDLKKVLTNVKTRGIWGEIQLENILEQIFTAQQYEKNVVTKKGSRDPVEFAIKLPGREGSTVYIPIDAKFPKEDYERLLAAQEKGDVNSIEEFGKALENRIKGEAKKIREKYIDPPNTTDFGVLYLPIEGLYAEVLRRPGLSDTLQREYRVNLAGPTTIAAFLNSLQMGFRTLAVEKRASEVWNLLGSVKKEFVKFGDILDKTHTRLKQASDEIESAARKSRTIEQRLKNVQHLPAADTTDESNLLEESDADVSIQ
jgi:DNA recombination protein RmuC